MMASKRKIFYIISHIHKSLGFEWAAMGLKDSFDLTFILLNEGNSLLEEFLIEKGIRVVRIKYRGKRDILRTFIFLYRLLRKEEPAVVHAHLFDASLLGLTAALLAGIQKRIYTRHNSTFHHIYFPAAVKYDRWINRMSTHVVSISQATDRVLIDMEQVPKNKIRKIPHGFVLETFTNVEASRVDYIRRKWGIPSGSPVIGVIARHIEWKGIQYIIPAFKKFLEQFPTACLVLANATGPYHKEICELLEGVPEQRIIFIPFEDDVAALYQVFNFYIHTPIDPLCEAFGQTYVECLAAGIPAIVTLSGIAAEFIQHEVNALVVDFKNSEQVYNSMIRLANDPLLSSRLSEIGNRDVFSCFQVDSMIDSLKNLYDA